MRFWPRFEKKSDATLADPDPALLEIFGITSLDLITKQQALEVPAVGAAVRAISGAVATRDIRVVRINADGTETDDHTHPVAVFLQSGHVNDWTSWFEFIRDLTAQALTSDKGGVAWVNRVNDKPQELIRYSDSSVGIDCDGVTGEPAYTLNEKQVNVADVIHLRGPFDRCPLSLAMRAATIAWHLENHAKTLFAEGARPDGVITFPHAMGETALKNAGAGWRAAFGGSGTGKKRTALLHNGADFKPLTFNSTDAQFLENRRFQVLEIARAFGVPPGMLFELERQTYTNGEQQQKEFNFYSLEPWFLALEACLHRALFSEDDRANYRIAFDRDDISAASLTERATAINGLIASETINPNTGRRWLGLQPYTGGDVYGNRNINVNEGKAPPEQPPKLRAV